MRDLSLPGVGDVAFSSCEWICPTLEERMKEKAEGGANVLDTHIKAHPRKKRGRGEEIAVACGFVPLLLSLGQC